MRDPQVLHWHTLLFNVTVCMSVPATPLPSHEVVPGGALRLISSLWSIVLVSLSANFPCFLLLPGGRWIVQQPPTSRPSPPPAPGQGTAPRASKGSEWVQLEVEMDKNKKKMNGSGLVIGGQSPGTKGAPRTSKDCPQSPHQGRHRWLGPPGM